MPSTTTCSQTGSRDALPLASRAAFRIVPAIRMIRPVLVFLALALVARGHDEVTPKPKLLQRGMPLAEVSGLPGKSQVYQIILPADVAKLTFKSARGTGDCDLFVRRGAHPTDENYEYSSTGPSTAESVSIDNPLDGPWYVLVKAYTPFRGVKLTANYDLAPGAIAVPLLLPAPGVYGGTASVRLKDETPGAVVRYTTDGAPVTAASPAYTAPLELSATTRVRVAAFGSGNAASPEVDVYYVIQQAGAVVELQSGRPLFHRCGKKGSEQLFKITVPSGQKSLRVRTEGGPGKSEVFIRQGEPPTPKKYFKRANGRGNNATFDMRDPAPGDWFILLRGRADFSGVSILASARANKPDLIVWRDTVDPFISVETFSALDCEVEEGMIDVGTHTLLRFTTQTRNIGGVDLDMPSPVNNPNFEYQACHGHYHFKSFASYRLLNKDGTPAALGKKESFCLEDIERWDPLAKPNYKYTCGSQGIQAGWADIYDGGLPGQWIDITGIPDGIYDLEITMDPLHVLDEADFVNNTEVIEVVLDTTGLLDPALPRSARHIVFRP